MDYFETLGIFNFDPIPVSDDLNEDYVFRIELLGCASHQEEYRVRVFRRDVFKLKSLTSGEWQDKPIWFEDVTLDWRLLKGNSTEDILSKIMGEIEYAFPFLFEDGVLMPKYNEIVKVIDIEPMCILETDSFCRFRIEIIKESAAQSYYRARSYRFERFELQPSYPIVEGKPKYERAAPVILIEDESSTFKNIDGETLDEVIQKILQVAEDLKSRSVPTELDIV